MKWSRFRSLYKISQIPTGKIGALRFFLSGFEKFYKGIEISTTSSSDFSNFSQSFCFGFLPTAAYGPPLGFPHLYGDFHHGRFGRARKRAKSANVLGFFGEQFTCVSVCCLLPRCEPDFCEGDMEVEHA